MRALKALRHLCATRKPIFPQPTTPTVFSSISTPRNFGRSIFAPERSSRSSSPTPRGGEAQGERQLRDRLAVDAGRARHGNALRLRRLEVDRVDADALLADDLELLRAREIRGADRRHAHHDAVGVLGPVPDARIVPAHHFGVLRGIVDACPVERVEDVDLHSSRNATPARWQICLIFSERPGGIGIPSRRRRARAAFSGSPGTSTGRAASTGGVACSTSITASRSSSNAPSGRNALGSMARKKWPRRAGTPGPRVLTRMGGNDGPGSVAPRMVAIIARPETLLV